MDEWGILTCVAAAGVGMLAFFKVVGDEVVVKHYVLELRLEAEEEERRFHNEKEADPGVVTQVQGMKSSASAPPVIDVDAA